VGVRASVYSTNIIKTIKLTDFCSIYTAEAYAISQTLEIIKQFKLNKALILSDSLSNLNILNSIRNINQPNIISRIIQNQISLLNNNNQNCYGFLAMLESSVMRQQTSTLKEP